LLVNLGLFLLTATFVSIKNLNNDFNIIKISQLHDFALFNCLTGDITK